MESDQSHPGSVANHSDSSGSHRDGLTGRDVSGDRTSVAGGPVQSGQGTLDGIQSQLDLVTLLVAVVGAGLLVGGLAETFAALFCLGVAAFTLYRLSRGTDSVAGSME